MEKPVQIWAQMCSCFNRKAIALICIAILGLLISINIYPQQRENLSAETSSPEYYIRQAKVQLAANNHELAVKNLLKAADIMESREKKEKLSMVYISVADIYAGIGALDNSADYYIKALQTGLFADPDTKATAEEKLGDVYFQMQQYDKSLQIYVKAAEYYQLAGKNKLLAELLNKMALTHRKAGNFRESLKVSERLLKIAYDSDRLPLRFKTLNNMGYDYARIEENQRAYESFKNAYETGIKMTAPADQMVEITNNISVCLYNMKKPREAIQNLQKVISSGKYEMSPAMQAKTENLLATIYLYSGDLYNAGQFSEQAVTSAIKSRDKYTLQNCYNTHSQVLKAGNDPIRALEYYEKYLSIRDSLLLEEKLSEQENARRKFDFEKFEKETRLDIADENMIEMRLIQSELERDRQRQQIDSLEQATKLTGLEYETERQAAALKLEQLIKNQTIQENERLRNDSIMQDLQIQIREDRDKRRVEDINRLEREKKQEQIVKRRATYIAVLLVIVAISILSGLLVTRKKNTLLASQKAEIQEKNYHLEQLNEEITAQKEMIEEKNTAITASITYAEKIQSAVLPPDNFFKENLSDYFIFFRPRDIVSGDFYWGSNKNGKLVIVAADCTGHGVPGAFMSMLGTAFLNEIVADMEYPESHHILDQLRMNVIEAMRQTGEEGEAKDGMDIALCVLDYDKMRLQFSGAFNPLYYIKDNELLAIKADRMPIGIHQKEVAGFTKNEIELKPGECFYLFSDGYIDQFGGPEGKKLKNKLFQELLLANHHRSMTEQKEILEKTFDDWKRGFDQIDDVLVMGIRM